MSEQRCLIHVPSKHADTWLTPPWITQALGSFDLDPCASPEKPDWIGAAKCFTEAGLTQPWQGRVFLNPPFSQWPEWFRHWYDVNGDGIALLLFAPETKAWRTQVWAKARAIKVLTGRVRFHLPNGSVSRGRPRGLVSLVALSGRDAAILRAALLPGVLLEEWQIR